MGHGREQCRQDAALPGKAEANPMQKIAQFLISPMVIGCCVAAITPAQVFSAPSNDFSAPSNSDWKEYQVPDFGSRVQYPAAIFSVSEGKSEVGVGERLSTADGRATLTIYSRANETGETPASYLRKNLRMSQSVIQYQRVTPSFFAISAARQGQIYYSRCNFSELRGRSIHCFDLVYPEREKRRWDDIVTRISLSLRPLQR
jgi:hypothetical protein